MAKTEQHDMREYAIVTAALAVSTASTIAHIPIPFSGQVIRCFSAIETVIAGGNALITFQLAGVNLLSGGLTATMLLDVASSNVGDIQVQEFDPLEPINLALEAQGGEAVTAGGALEIITDGGSATGAATFAVVISP